MKSLNKKHTGASWRVSILRARAHHLGTVKVPDEKAADAFSVKTFGLSEDAAQAREPASFTRKWLAWAKLTQTD
jgi:hypothetical protein